MRTHGPNNKDARRHHGKRSQKRLFLVILLLCRFSGRRLAQAIIRSGGHLRGTSVKDITEWQMGMGVGPGSQTLLFLKLPATASALQNGCCHDAPVLSVPGEAAPEAETIPQPRENCIERHCWKVVAQAGHHARTKNLARSQLVYCPPPLPHPCRAFTQRTPNT